MASMQMTVTDKVLSCLRENTGQGPVSVAGTDPAWAKELSEFELDLRDWGVVYGMAFGIARSEQPFETLEAAAERAYDPAQLAWAAWSGPGFRERGDQDALVADVLTAYSKLSADETIALPRKLDAALTEMSNKLGVRA